ncbi:FecR domain-containing protein [Asticcacaulis sp. AND118]|uniref:FecR family protein n=1 Tax=Asticcacaulis sp. AND118 TaxID=2840468 RepID=UPI001CFFBE6F|nr:FecR domain-containing protein [Asticcacaulis sp. AND118]UDF05025.1 FecR domain-containing protein [Asticcacaulis sp. AND118]
MSAIDDQASAYIAARASGDWSEADQAALTAWLEADTRHQGAFFRAEAAWAMLNRASVMGAGVDPETVRLDTDPVEPIENKIAAPSTKPTRRQVLMGGGLIAASAAGAALVLPMLDRHHLQTEVGELRKVPLKDRSLASVNTDSALDIRLSEKRRDVRLIKGEAWFQVAKDANRPFVVEADTVRARAVGTAFGVRRYPNGAEVMVSEGVVEVWNAHAPDTPVRVEAGARVFVPYAPQTIRAQYAPDAVDRGLAWRDGQIALDNDSLAHAAAEFNRYNSRKIVIADAALGDEKLVGWFRADQPDTFARAVQVALNAPVELTEDRIVIGAK